MSWDGNRLDDVRDRVEGTVLGAAVGDALGAPWEFGPPLRPEQPLGMTGGGTFGWVPGEWTDDTSMAVPILRELADGADLADDPALGRIARSWAEWARSAPDVGIQTREVLHRARLAAAGGWADELTADHVRRAAATVHDSHGRSAGNGSLMRTFPIALAYLDRSDEELAAAAVRVSELTHFDPRTGQACALWSVAIKHAVLTGTIDLQPGLAVLEARAAEFWRDRIGEAQGAQPADFDRNGWVVQALQAAWSAIAGTPPGGPVPLVLGLERAVRGGRDSDTVAAITGGLLGAAYGRSAIPAAWLDPLHGWPGLTGDDLARLARDASRLPSS